MYRLDLRLGVCLCRFECGCMCVNVSVSESVGCVKISTSAPFKSIFSKHCLTITFLSQNPHLSNQHVIFSYVSEDIMGLSLIKQTCFTSAKLLFVGVYKVASQIKDHCSLFSNQ